MKRLAVLALVVVTAAGWAGYISGGTLLLLLLGARGFTGWGLQVGRWSWSARTGKHRIDTPGPGSVELGGRPVAERRRRRR